MSKETITGTEKVQVVSSGNPNELKSIAKAYRLINTLILLLLFSMIAIFFMAMADYVGTSPLVFAFPLFFALLNFTLIVSTAYLGTKVAGMGWILSLLLSFFGNLIAAIIFTRLAAKRLKENGYNIGLINATSKTSVVKSMA